MSHYYQSRLYTSIQFTKEFLNQSFSPVPFFVILMRLVVNSHGIESKRGWKSSVLATLFCEVDSAVVAGIKPVGKMDMDTITRSTSVSLDRTSPRLKLVTRWDGSEWNLDKWSSSYEL